MTAKADREEMRMNLKHLCTRCLQPLHQQSVLHGFEKCGVCRRTDRTKARADAKRLAIRGSMWNLTVGGSRPASNVVSMNRWRTNKSGDHQ